MSQFGLTILSNTRPDKQFSLSIVNNARVDRQFSLSVISFTTVYVEICDESLNPLIADLKITGGSSIDGIYSGQSIYQFNSDTAEDITFNASLFGYMSASAIEDINEHGYKVIKLVLTNDFTIFISCDTVAVDAEGNEISSVIEGGKIKVTFTADSPFDIANYYVSLEAYKEGNNKDAVVSLNGELTDSTPNTVTYIFDAVDDSGTWCYIPNIIRRQC